MDFSSFDQLGSAVLDRVVLSVTACASSGNLLEKGPPHTLLVRLLPSIRRGLIALSLCSLLSVPLLLLHCVQMDDGTCFYSTEGLKVVGRQWGPSISAPGEREGEGRKGLQTTQCTAKLDIFQMIASSWDLIRHPLMGEDTTTRNPFLRNRNLFPRRGGGGACSR